MHGTLSNNRTYIFSFNNETAKEYSSMIEELLLSEISTTYYRPPALKKPV